jgi:hypothetical protein
MIDDEREVHELIEALKEHLPMRAYATSPLVKALQEGVDIKMNEAVEIDSVLYLGDEGGISCAIGMWGGNGVVTSITHLRFDRDHPLAERIEAYQLRRSQQLGAPISHSSRRARAKLAAKLKRKRKARR